MIRLESFRWLPPVLRQLLAWPTNFALSKEVSRASGKPTNIEVIDRRMYRRMVLDVERTSDGFKVYTDRQHGRRLQETFMDRTPSVLELLRRPDCIAHKTTVCIGDGVTVKDTTDTPMIAFCATRGHAAVLIPDYSFLRTQGYASLRHWADNNWREWDLRSASVLWRGATSGAGRISSPEMMSANLMPRVQLCLIARDIPETDVKIATIAQSSNRVLDRYRLGQAGIMGDQMPVESWVNRKFAIDIDGNTNSFGTLLARLIQGCCVLKVASPQSWHQWFYESVQPWVHFIPIKSDLSDLAEKFAWCRENDSECQQIAANGRMFAYGLDFETESQAAVQRINRAFARSD